MTKTLFWLFLLFLLNVCHCEEVSVEDDSDADVQDAKEEELTLDPHAEMEKGDFSDEDFPEHEPMYQPFEETYEEEQAKQAETPIPADKVEKETVFLHDPEELFDVKFKKPKLQLDGMADHEPIYQPEDPGDEAEVPPDHHHVIENEEQSQETYDDDDDNDADDDVASLKVHDEVVIDEDVKDVYEHDDAHEPLYQPGDQDINEHDEL